VNRSLIDRLDLACWRFAAAALAAPGAEVVPQPDWLAMATPRRPIEWRNHVVRTPLWQRLHVEYFALPGEIAVLHLCAFPRPEIALPILGFDVITGRERATGCFLDLSPTVPEAEPCIAAWGAWVAPQRAALGEARVLPEWTAIFSPEVVAVRPEGLEGFEAGVALGEATLLGCLRDTRQPRAEPMAMLAAQARYIAAQRRNDRTRRMLAGCVGPEMADSFIAECLFPDLAAA